MGDMMGDMMGDTKTKNMKGGAAKAEKRKGRKAQAAATEAQLRYGDMAT